MDLVGGCFSGYMLCLVSCLRFFLIVWKGREAPARLHTRGWLLFALPNRLYVSVCHFRNLGEGIQPVLTLPAFIVLGVKIHTDACCGSPGSWRGIWWPYRPPKLWITMESAKPAILLVNKPNSPTTPITCRLYQPPKNRCRVPETQYHRIWLSIH